MIKLNYLSIMAYFVVFWDVLRWAEGFTENGVSQSRHPFSIGRFGRDDLAVSVERHFF